MDVRFLKNISEAYVMDSDLKQEPDQIFEELYDVVKFLQTYDIKLYDELYEGTKLQQQRILKNYLDISYEQEEQPLTEDIVIPTTAIILTIVGAVFGKSIAKGITKVLSIIGKAFETFGKWVARQGKYQQVRYAIIQENTRKCYARCGIQKPSDIRLLTYVTIKAGSAIGGEKTIVQGKCLRECYIEELIETIALHMENYFACLKKTGNFDVVQKTDSDDIMKMVSSTNVAAACESYYTAAKEALDNFYKVLELVYDSYSEADMRLEKVNALRTRIYAARQTVQNIGQKEIQRYEQPSFKPQQRQERLPFKPQQGQDRQSFNPHQKQNSNNNPNFRRN